MLVIKIYNKNDRYSMTTKKKLLKYFNMNLKNNYDLEKLIHLAKNGILSVEPLFNN